MLTHIWQNLEISLGCPMCSKGFQNVASLHKHGQQVHSVNIVELDVSRVSKGVIGYIRGNVIKVSVCKDF